MCRLKYYNLVFSTICALSVLWSVPDAYADGDPTELVASSAITENSVSADEGTLLPDEQAAPPEEAVATVTADGDFLLPTYLLPGETATVERTTTVEKVYEKTPPKIATMTIPVAQQTTIQQKTITKTTEPKNTATLTEQTPAALPPVTVPAASTKRPPSFPVNPVPNSTIVIQERVELPVVDVKDSATMPAAPIRAEADGV
ncbi:MAG: hypothetical protein SPL08_04335, partial [Pseudomonadota bacterium]|nr:hypothetical protein [Pseudomonadota bacterium]